MSASCSKVSVVVVVVDGPVCCCSCLVGFVYICVVCVCLFFRGQWQKIDMHAKTDGVNHRVYTCVHATGDTHTEREREPVCSPASSSFNTHVHLYAHTTRSKTCPHTCRAGRRRRHQNPGEGKPVFGQGASLVGEYDVHLRQALLGLEALDVDLSCVFGFVWWMRKQGGCGGYTGQRAQVG